MSWMALSRKWKTLPTEVSHNNCFMGPLSSSCNEHRFSENLLLLFKQSQSQRNHWSLKSNKNWKLADRSRWLTQHASSTCSSKRYLYGKIIGTDPVSVTLYQCVFIFSKVNEVQADVRKFQYQKVWENKKVQSSLNS